MNEPDDALIREILALRPLSVTELRARYLALFGEETASRNKDYLFKRIAYRMQEQKYGGLSRAAVARAELLAAQAPIRRRPPREKPCDLEVATTPTSPVVLAVVRDPACHHPAPSFAASSGARSMPSRCSTTASSTAEPSTRASPRWRR